MALRRQLMLAVNPQAVVTNDLCEAKLLRAIYSTHQLQELLTDFWFNHFNVFLERARTAICHLLRARSDPVSSLRQIPRPAARNGQKSGHAFLSGQLAVGSPEEKYRQPNSKERKRGLNENYGRELLELHTLGSGRRIYAEDVTEVARCFTGWTIANPRKGGGFRIQRQDGTIKGEKWFWAT